MALDEDLNRVIEAIDKLRRRKNRPNLPSIARFLFRSYGFFSDKTIGLLEILLAQNRVKEVVYKGNISFRNMLRWRQPTRPAFQRLDTRVDTWIVVTTMLRLLLEDRDKEDDAGGISETRLQAALIEQLNGAVKLKEIRKQIQVEVDKGTLGKNEAGDFILLKPEARKNNSVDLDMDELSDSSELADAETSPESTNDSLLENSVDSQTNSNETPVVIKQPVTIPDHKKILENLDRSIDNVVNNIQNIEDSDMTEPEPEVSRKIKRQEQDICVPNDTTTSDTRDKRRRIIRKKTIYDPSEFELTPLIKRNKRRAANANTTTRGRGGRGRRGLRDGKMWVSTKEVEVPSSEVISDTSHLSPDLPVDEKCESTSDVISPADSPKDKEKKCRGKPPTHVNKKCCICFSRADKTDPNIFSCSLCLNIGHKDCVPNDSFYKGSMKWRCEDCKEYNPVFCSLCELEANKKQVLLMCDFCEEFFHVDCHYPPVELPLVERTWRCSACPPVDRTEKVKNKIEEEPLNSAIVKTESEESLDTGDIKPSVILSNVIDKATSPPPVTKCNVLQSCDKGNVEPKKESNVKNNNHAPITLKLSGCIRHKPNEPIPLVDDWTVQQVSDYFLEKFGKDVADAFQTQEVDGKFLKQMSRQYVTNDLGLQLGIALKVLYYVKKIQLGTNLFQRLWAST